MRQPEVAQQPRDDLEGVAMRNRGFARARPGDIEFREAVRAHEIGGQFRGAGRRDFASVDEFVRPPEFDAAEDRLQDGRTNKFDALE